MRTYSKNRPRVVLVVLKRHTAVSGTVGVDVRLHPVIGEGVLATQGGRSRHVLGMALRENTPHKAGTLAGSVVGHVLAGDGAGRTSTLPVEEDHENQGTDKSDTSNHTDDDSSNGASAQAGAVTDRLGGRGVKSRG